MDDVLARLRAALADRYAIEHELGRGGMAVVLAAQDLRHGRRVAIKALPADVDPLATERFVREVRTVAQMQHAHIVPLHDSGVADGTCYFVMPLVEGETLRARLQRTGPLPLDEALRLARELADALEYAHARGVVHRDVKPENVFLSSGHALLADFGIARPTGRDPAALTATGLVVGTLRYMSPEQLRGTPPLDGRSDQYALALVLHEMLTGTLPEAGSRVTLAREGTAPRAVPSGVAAAIARALAEHPADRWPSMREFAAALGPGDTAPATAPRNGMAARPRGRAVGLAVAGLALAVVVVLGRGAVGAPAAGAAVPSSVAVLPFTFDGDSAHALLADGLAEGLVTGLVRAGLVVLDPARARAASGGTEDPVDLGRRLDVDAVVAARLRVRDGLVRVTAQLTDVADGRLRWREEFDGQPTDGPGIRTQWELTDAMRDRILAELVPALAGRGAAAGPRAATDAEAYEQYLLGRRALANPTLAGAEPALRHFEAAVARDSGFADAWIGVATALDQLLQLSGRPPHALIQPLLRAVDRAADLDSLHPGVFTHRARARLYLEFDVAGHDAEMRRGLAAYPNDARLHLAYAQDLVVRGLVDSALAELGRAAGLDAADPFIAANQGDVLTTVGRTAEARVAGDRALALDPTQWLPHLDRAILASHEGRDADAAAAIREAAARIGDSPWIAGWVVQCTVRADPAAARAELARLEARARREYVQHVFLAHARLGAGDRAGALDALEESVRLPDRDLVVGLGFGLFEALRGEARYERLLARTNLAEGLRAPDRVRQRGARRTACRT